MKRKLFMIFAIAISMACLLTGCSDEPISGEIKDKEFLPAYTCTVMTSHVISNGKTVTTILIPIVYSYPDRWRLTIEDEDSGKLKDIYVTQECFDSVNIGDWFTYDPEFCTYDEPVIKQRQ